MVHLIEKNDHFGTRKGSLVNTRWIFFHFYFFVKILLIVVSKDENTQKGLGLALSLSIKFDEKLKSSISFMHHGCVYQKFNSALLSQHFCMGKNSLLALGVELISYMVSTYF